MARARPRNALVLALSLALLAGILLPVGGSSGAISLQHAGGAIVFAFDGGYATHLAAASILEAQGYRGTFYVVSDQLRSGPYYTDFLSAEDVANLSASGHEIGSHSVDHADLTTLDATALRHELVDSKAALEGIVGKPVLHFAYPAGATDATVSAATSLSYLTGRLVTTDITDFLHAPDAQHLPAIMLTQTTTLATAEGYVDFAVANHVIVLLEFQGITATPGAYDWTPADLAALAAYVSAQGVAVKTVGQAFGAAAGPSGPAGPAGATGATGATGAQGPAGADGSIGPQGPAGVDGAVGPQGPVGADGSIGPQGPVGADGAIGPQGPVGADGAIGPTGPTGADGPQGPIGPQGPAGADGAVGPAGPQGAAGPTGATGPQGATGVTGAPGPAGPAGAAGAHGTNGTNGTNGAQGPAGATGPQGPAGAAGPSWMAGSNGGLTPNNGGNGNYYPPNSGDASTTESAVQVQMPVGGTLRNLTVRLDTNAGSGNTWTFMLRKNGADTGVTCLITGSSQTTCADTTHSATVAANDLLDLRAVGSSSPTNFAHMTWSALY